MQLSKLCEAIAQSEAVIQDIMSRINKSKLKTYRSDNNYGDDWADDEMVEYFLEDEYGISIDADGYIEFYDLSPEIERLIGNNKIKLYHFAPDKYQDDIKRDGLEPGKVKTNPHKNSYSGIYLTTKISGKEIDGYKYHIRNTHGGGVILVSIWTTLDEIRPDPDDAGLASGKSQFIINRVSPSQIIDIERTY